MSDFSSPPWDSFLLFSLTFGALCMLLGSPYYPEVVGGTSITVGLHSDYTQFSPVKSSNEGLFIGTMHVPETSLSPKWLEMSQLNQAGLSAPQPLLHRKV